MKNSVAIVVSSVDAVSDALGSRVEAQFEPHQFGSLTELLASAPDRLVGVVLDMKTLHNATRDERARFDERLRSAVPVLELNFTSARDPVSRQLFERRWRTFVDQALAQSPRSLRSSPRRSLFLRVEVCRGARWQEDAKIRAFTADLSSGGCFVVSADEWRPNEKVLLRIESFAEPIECRVAWQRDLAQSRLKLPGVGIEFQTIDPQVAPRLQHLLQNGNDA